MKSLVHPGSEQRSILAAGQVGVLAIHGFTGSPASVSGVADVMEHAGFDVEVPRLPGHGTVVDDMLITGWNDWFGEVDRAYDQLARRTEQVVVFGQSMGGSLALATALDRLNGPHPVSAVICVNPITKPRDAETMAMIDDFIEDGLAIVPGEGSDIADPEGSDFSYDGTPLEPLRSLLVEGVTPIADRFGELKVPLLLFTSRQDHVVEPENSEFLAATWGGPVEHVWLERSYHVATKDFDRELLETRSQAFVAGLVTT